MRRVFGFGKERPFDRQEALRAAEDWRAKKKPKKAIAELQKILAVDPNDAVAHARIAPLLVLAGQAQQAEPSLRIAAADLEARGFADKALSLHLQRAEIDVRNTEAWETVARLHSLRGRAIEGSRVLVTGASRQQGRDGRPRAIQLLKGALALTPDQLDLLLQLARLSRKEGLADEARALLDRAVSISSGKTLKRVRWAYFSLFPGFGTFWRWLRA